jgi:hypothetical protein
MNPMNGKDQQSYRPEDDADADGHVEYVAGYQRSWLDRATGRDESVVRSQERAVAAEVFLHSCLFPLAETSQNLDEATLVDLLVEFKRLRRDLDGEFQMAHISARLLSRFECYLIDDEDATPAVSDSAVREMDLFSSLADLDFQHIDVAVRERLHSD